jgi:hypothetical protein
VPCREGGRHQRIEIQTQNQSSRLVTTSKHAGQFLKMCKHDMS